MSIRRYSSFDRISEISSCWFPQGSIPRTQYWIPASSVTPSSTVPFRSFGRWLLDSVGKSQVGINWPNLFQFRVADGSNSLSFSSTQFDSFVGGRYNTFDGSAEFASELFDSSPPRGCDGRRGRRMWGIGMKSGFPNNPKIEPGSAAGPTHRLLAFSCSQWDDVGSIYKLWNRRVINSATLPPCWFANSPLWIISTLPIISLAVTQLILTQTLTPKKKWMDIRGANEVNRPFHFITGRLLR